MTDYADLVKRLRAVFVEDRGHGHTSEYTRNLDGPEAADAIEALVRERDKLKASREWWTDEADKTQQRAEAAEAEAAKLKEALTLIKQAMKGGPDNVSDDDITAVYDFARRALEVKP